METQNRRSKVIQWYMDARLINPDELFNLSDPDDPKPIPIIPIELNG